MAYYLIEMGGIQIQLMSIYSVGQFHLTQHLIEICAVHNSNSSETQDFDIRIT
jgi:hypothetical protein